MYKGKGGGGDGGGVKSHAVINGLHLMLVIGEQNPLTKN